MPEICQWVININYLAARLRQIYSKSAARFICMVKLHCRNLAEGLRQSSSKLAARSPLALPQGLFFGKGIDTLYQSYLLDSISIFISTPDNYTTCIWVALGRNPMVTCFSLIKTELV